MATSHIRSIAGNVIKFIKTKLFFLVSKFRLLFSKRQARKTRVDELSLSLNKDERRDGMTTFCSPNINEVSVQVKCKNKMYRSRIDIYANLCQHNLRPRIRVLSRIPTAQIKHVLQKSKKVIIEVQKHTQNFYCNYQKNSLSWEFSMSI